MGNKLFVIVVFVVSHGKTKKVEMVKTFITLKAYSWTQKEGAINCSQLSKTIHSDILWCKVCTVAPSAVLFHSLLSPDQHPTIFRSFWTNLNQTSVVKKIIQNYQKYRGGCNSDVVFSHTIYKYN